MIDDMHDSKVTVKKEELLNTMRHNREKHKTELDTAMAEYRVKLQELAEVLVYSLKEGKAGNKHDLLALQEPPSHLRDYDTVIRMLEMSVKEEVTISQQQFEWYVLDEWHWQHQFKAIASSYHGEALARRR